MNKNEDAFDPALITSSLQCFRLHKEAENISFKGIDRRYIADESEFKIHHKIDSRDLFYQLNQPNKIQNLIPFAYGFLENQLMESEQACSSLLVQDYSDEQLEKLNPPKVIPLSEHLATADNLNQCIKQFAAIELTQPYWLQNIFQVFSSQSACAIELMSIYRGLTKLEPGEGNVQGAYHALLLSNGGARPVFHRHDYCQQPDIISGVFSFASTQLALALFPRVLFAEILGFTLAYCQTRSLLEICFPQYQESGSFFKLRQQRLEEQKPPILACIKGYLDQFPRNKAALWHKVQNGFLLYHLQIQGCRNQVSKVLDMPLLPQLAVSKLFQKKAMAAIGHHQKIQLNGQTLDSWFAGMPKNNHEFLQVLVQSEYVDKENPADSPLLKLFDFNGPMYGVFDQSERMVLEEWLTEGLSGEGKNTVEEPEKSAAIQLPSRRINKVKNISKLNNRQLYYYLLNADLFPEILPVLQIKLSKLLRLCGFFNPPPFINYSHKQFDTYIENIYQREMSAYQPFSGKPKISREAYVWGIEQIAPMILIDGCWLQNSLSLQNINPEIAEILFSIYCDELGNGCLEQNHSYIFQQLLNSLSIIVPPVYSTEFIENRRFINSAFDLPVYMLSLSNFSVEFLPELLGLNMAIELSGLGKGYMSLVDEWNYWEIDSTIANIHISIDNYASGHTYLAKKAIQLYLDDVIKRTGDASTLDRHWRRIYCGYASLRFVGGRFKVAMPMGYLIDKFGRKKE